MKNQSPGERASLAASLSTSWLGDALVYRPFLVLIALGVAVRAALMILYFPAVLLAFDSPRYARVGDWQLFDDFWMPAGYPMLLLLLRTISNQLWFTIAVQHAIGLGTGAALYLSGCRLGLPRSVACVPAAIALLSGDHLYLEHSLMADFLLTFLVAVGLYAAVCGLLDTQGLWAITAASICLAAAALVRSVGIVSLPVLVFCVLLSPAGSMGARLARIVTAIVPGVLLIVAYAVSCRATGGTYLGISDMRGWNLYSRVAPFADCRKFTPPADVAIVCEQRPPRERPGPFGYVWDLESVPRKSFPLGPDSGKALERFAFQAILHQPMDYARAVMIDLVRFVSPQVNGSRPYSGQPREIISFGWRDTTVEEMVVSAMTWNYKGVAVQVHAPQLLASYQNVFRVGGVLLVVAVGFTVAGLLSTQRGLRLGCVLYGGAGLGLYILPVATLSYDFRYGIPPSTFVVFSGVLGAVAVTRALIRRKAAVQPRT